MAHISSIGSAMFTKLEVAAEVALPTGDDALTTTQFFEIRNVKEFPAIGKPANIVKVPEYGSDTSLQIQGQADSPTMEITLNYVPAEWANGIMSDTGGVIKVGKSGIYTFRFALLSKQPTGVIVAATPMGTPSVDNSCFYFKGKIEALEVTPSLTDAMTAKLTISVQSEIVGAFTYTNA
jgi:hypothetical protein